MENRLLSLADKPEPISPFEHFTRPQWARFRAETPLTLTADEVERLQGLNDPVSIDEVVAAYLPLSRLLSLYAEATQSLYRATAEFLGTSGPKVPFIIGIAGSVSAGKSATARVLRELLSRWPASPKVDLITTDGFLLPNAVLEKKDLMRRKGFPESYDVSALLRFLSNIKAGSSHVSAPTYSHFFYDVQPGKLRWIDRPDILILEGLNILQARRATDDAKAVPFVSDFLDFSIFIDADEDHLERWYIERFFRLRETAFTQQDSFFYRYSQISDEQARDVANDLWSNINLVNLRENILPSRPRADLILKKDSEHFVESVQLRKI